MSRLLSFTLLIFMEFANMILCKFVNYHEVKEMNKSTVLTQNIGQILVIGHPEPLDIDYLIQRMPEGTEGQMYKEIVTIFRHLVCLTTWFCMCKTVRAQIMCHLSAELRPVWPDYMIKGNVSRFNVISTKDSVFVYLSQCVCALNSFIFWVINWNKMLWKENQLHI